MTQEDLDRILDACKPTVCIKIGEYTGSSPQENANRAWAELAQRMKFDPMTVQPMEGKGERFFTAVPIESECQKQERLQREAKIEREREIELLKAQIVEAQKRLRELCGEGSMNCAGREAMTEPEINHLIGAECGWQRDYYCDLNAMRQALLTLKTVEQIVNFERHLGAILSRDLTGGSLTLYPWIEIVAECKQYAEAFLRTLGKWQEKGAGK